MGFSLEILTDTPVLLLHLVLPALSCLVLRRMHVSITTLLRLNLGSDFTSAAFSGLKQI